MKQLIDLLKATPIERMAVSYTHLDVYKRQMRILEELTFKWGRSVISIQIKNARRI